LLKIAKLINYIQALLWKQPLFATEKLVADKLYLCIGMPVMIRNNSATELCITKEQEGTVGGLQSTKGPHGKLVLDTIFVKLDNLPQPVKFDKNLLTLLAAPQTRTFKTQSHCCTDCTLSALPPLHRNYFMASSHSLHTCTYWLHTVCTPATAQPERRAAAVLVGANTRKWCDLFLFQKI